MSVLTRDRPAILGGTPVRPGGPPDWPRADESIRSQWQRLIETGEWGRYHGPHGKKLSDTLAAYHDIDHVLLCSSGTAAIELALRGLKVGPQDEVILAGYDFKANFQNVLCLGAVPVLIDLDPATWQLDPDRIAAAITPRTRVVIASHLHGGLVDLSRVKPVAESHGIGIIEDACQNPGATLSRQRAGTWGDVGVLSFGGSKLLTAGRGGAIVTRSTEIAERIKRYVLRGNDAYPLSEMQAAVLLPQLNQLDELNMRRGAAVQKLCQHSERMKGLTPLQLPEMPLKSPSYYKLGFRYSAGQFGGLSRDLFAEAIRAEGIAFDPGFRALHLIHASRRFRAADSLMESQLADREMLTLHHPVLLDGDDAIEQILFGIERIRAHAEEIIAHAPSRC